MATRATALSRRGSALLSCIVLAVAMAGVSAAVISTSLFRHGSARSAHERERAFQVALSGIDLALFEMQEGVDLGVDGIGNTSITDASGSFVVTIGAPFAGSGEYVLRSSGRYGPMREGTEFVVTDKPREPFGFFGRDSITMSGSASADSYDSTAGSYASQYFFNHAGDEGHLRSNGEIMADGGQIFGNATPGVGFAVTGDPSNVTGSTAAATTPLVLDPYAYSPSIASAGAFSTGGTATLSAGSHRFDEFTVSSNGVVTISGDVVLYVDAKIDLTGSASIDVPAGSSLVIHHGSGDLKVSGGGVMNGNQRPKDVQVFSATSGIVEISGGSSFYGSVYAPEADFVSSGGSDLYGSFVGAKATISGDGMVHIDSSLDVFGSAGDGFRVKSARRVSPTGI